MAPRLLPQRVLDEGLDKVDYYALLGVSRQATAAEVRDAFHQFALTYHPDQYPDDLAGARRVLRIFKRGTEGYRVLLDPVLRARYDAALNRGELRLTAETERQAVLAEARLESAKGEAGALPAEHQPLYDKVREALTRGDLVNARAFMMLLGRKSAHPKVQELTKELLEAEKARKLPSRR
jgi:curved DNA-binding protein CbpA